jgi:hypothetical protein
MAAMPAPLSRVQTVRYPIPTDAECASLPMWPEASRLLGIRRSTAYTQVMDGTYPIPVYRVGTQWRCATADVRRTLGLDPFKNKPLAASDRLAVSDTDTDAARDRKARDAARVRKARAAARNSVADEQPEPTRRRRATA